MQAEYFKPTRRAGFWPTRILVAIVSFAFLGFGFFLYEKRELASAISLNLVWFLMLFIDALFTPKNFRISTEGIDVVRYTGSCYHISAHDIVSVTPAAPDFGAEVMTLNTAGLLIRNYGAYSAPGLGKFCGCLGNRTSLVVVRTKKGPTWVLSAERAERFVEVANSVLAHRQVGEQDLGKTMTVTNRV